MAPVQKNVLAPGDSTVVELKFNARTAPLNHAKTVNAEITSNDPTAGKSIRIRFSAQAVPDTDSVSTVVFSPKSTEFGPEKKKSELIVKNVKDSVDIRIVSVSPDMDNIKVDYPDKALGKGKKTEVKLEWSGPVPEYDIERSLTFETGSPSFPRFSVPYVIKGLKGKEPPKTPQHAAKQSTAKPLSPVASPATSGAIKREGHPLPPSAPAKVDTSATKNPLGTQAWPPK
jgi:hypothetical protein